MGLKIEGPVSITTNAMNGVDSVTTHYNGVAPEPVKSGFVADALQFPIVHHQPDYSCGIENMIQRFSPYCCNDRTVEMDEDAEGEWVRLSDVKAILENL